jgi:hypothetical protein
MTPGERALLVLAAGCFVVYLVHCMVWPYVRCPVCKGRGVITSGKYYADCPAAYMHRRKRLRLGARLVRPDLRRK